MNKFEKKIFRGLIEKKLSDQNSFSDSDGEDNKEYETPFKTDTSVCHNQSLTTNYPYLSKH